MGSFTYADGIAVAQLVFYAPALLVTLFLLFKKFAFAWFFLTTFSILRIVGGVTRLLTISNPNSDGIWTTALICTILGLSPLLMSTLSLLSRVLDAFHKSSTVMIIVTLVHMPAGVALILCIVGASSAASALDITQDSKVKAGVTLYVVCLAALLCLELYAYLRCRKTGAGEGILILVLLVAQPFLWVRVIYGLLVVYSTGGTFGLQTGSQTADLCMAVLEEMFVVLIYLAAGLKLDAKPTRRVQRDTEKQVRATPTQ